MEPTTGDLSTLLEAMRAERPELEAIEGIRSFRPSYRFFPAQLTLRFRSGETADEVLKTSNTRESAEFERRVLEALRELGLPVPRARSRVFAIPEGEGTRWGLLLQVMDGSPLDWLGVDNLHLADRSCSLALRGIDRLHRLTDRVLQHPVASTLPKKSLEDELERIKSGGPWLSEGFFRDGLEVLVDLLPRTVPLVFTNGDYNPLNFLAKDGEVVGWVDFEHACFEDPHIGFAKFVLWADDSFGWATGVRAGLVERYVFHHDIRPSDLYLRIVLRGLYHIHRRSVSDPPLYMIEVVKTYTEKLRAPGKGPGVMGWCG